MGRGADAKPLDVLCKQGPQKVMAMDNCAVRLQSIKVWRTLSVQHYQTECQG